MSEKTTGIFAALDAFATGLKELLKGIIESTVEIAVKGVLANDEEPDEDYGIYHEISFDEIDRILEPLTELGITLAPEKLSEFLDEHPDVDYTDPHNAGITVYLQEQAMQRAPEQPRETELNSTLLELLSSGIPFKGVELCGKKRDPLSSIVLQKLDKQILYQHDLSQWKDVLTAPVLEIYPWQHDSMVAVLDCDHSRVIGFSKQLKGIAGEESLGRSNDPCSGMKPPSM
jgi:hypothetical protein